VVVHPLRFFHSFAVSVTLQNSIYGLKIQFQLLVKYGLQLTDMNQNEICVLTTFSVDPSAKLNRNPLNNFGDGLTSLYVFILYIL
jgi:hypothetical protein